MSETATPPALPEWAATLPDDIKPIVSAKGWKEPADMAKSYANLEKTLGTKRLPTPAADWKPEQWDALYKELGRPETPDKYTVPEYKFPEGVAVDEGRMKDAKAVFHKVGVLPHQATELLKYHFDVVSKEANAMTEHRQREQEAAEFKLKDEWKGDYESKVKLAKDALAKFGGDELITHLNATGLGNHPALVKAFADIGSKMLEDSASGRAVQSTTGGDPDTAKAEIKKMKDDPDVMGKFYGGDKEVAAKWRDLHIKAFGTEPIKT
jgi:hypothetical protein